MSRCYSLEYYIKTPTYKDVTVCEEWHNFQNFAEWCSYSYIKEFHLDWEKENKILPYMNQGYGTLQNLMIDSKGKKVFHITNNDRVIVATVIQWLGTNIGQHFLENTLKKCGLKIVKIEDDKER